MFFLTEKKEEKTVIDNKFFEQVLPVLEPKYLKVYLYGYYLAQNAQALGVKNLKDIEKELSMTHDEALQAFDYLQACGLIVKHFVENSTTDNYSVEFLPFTNSANNTYIKNEEIETQNNKIKQMYDNIEEITKNFLTPYNIKKIDTFIRNNDVAYDVVVEAFKFNMEQKKTASVAEAIKTLRQWAKDGIMTTRDLDTTLNTIDDQYDKRRKIFKYWGEVFRLPTEPEKEMMDTWMYVYNFSLEVIYKAIDETTKTKSPSFRYLNAVLTKWHEVFNKYGKKIIANDMTKEQFSEHIKNIFKLNSFTDEDKKIIRFFYENYPIDAITSSFGYINEKITLQSVFSFLTGQREYDDYYSGEITFDEMNNALEKYKLEQQSSIDNLKETFNKSQKTGTQKSKKRLSYNETDITEEELEALLFPKNDSNK